MPKILYIEDDPDIAELVRRWVERRGHQLLHAPDGPTGLALAAAELATTLGPDDLLQTLLSVERQFGRVELAFVLWGIDLDGQRDSRTQ